MPTISDLNIRLGVFMDDQALRKIENELRASGRRLSSLGNDLSLAISAPLGALGFQAIKATGDMEALRLAMRSTFEGAGKSIQEADAELQALQKAALAPGLDFEQAVRGSIRLQAVGFSAEKARETISQLANAISTTGGTADDLNEVVNQFSQMIGKGKVFQDDIKIILGRMPKLAQIMQDTFGTVTAEGLNALGVDARTFVDTVTKEMEKLPRVSGGISNSLVNIGSAVKQFLAGIGEEINRAFNLGELGDRLTVQLQGVVKSFSELDDETKRLVVQFGALLVAAGPVIKVFGVMQNTGAQLVSVYRDIVGGAKAMSAAFATTVSTAANMRLALLAATGGVAAVVLGIAAAVSLMADNFDAAEFAAKKFETAQQEVRSEAAKEIAQLTKNIDVLRDLRSTTDERKAAIDDLLKTYPGYLKGVDLEKASLERLNEIQKKLTDNIIRGIAERKKADAINSIYEKQADILLRIQEIQRTGKTTVAENTLIDTGDMIRSGGRAAAIIEKLRAQVKDLGTQANTTAADFDKAFGLATRSIDPLLEKQYRAREAAEEARDAFLGLGGAVGNSTDKASEATSRASSNAGKIANSAKEYQRALDAINAVAAKGDVLGADVMGEQAREIESQIERLISLGFNRYGKAVTSLRDRLTAIRQGLTEGFGFENITQEAVGQVAQLSTLIDTLQNVEAGSEAWKGAITQLTTAYPAYLSGIKLENAGLEELNKIEQELTASILKNIEARRAQQQGKAIVPANKPGAITPVATLQTATSVQSFEVSGAELAIAQAKAFTQSLHLAQGAYDALAESLQNSSGLTQIKAVFAEMENGAISFGDAITQSARIFQEKYSAVAQETLGSVMDIASGIVQIQANRAEQEKAILDEEYAARIDAAKGNAAQVEGLQKQLAQKKARIDKDIAKKEQDIAIVQAVINTALSVTQALSSAPPPYSFILAALAAAAGAVQIGVIKSQSFAEGGVVKKPTFALVGEYPSARRNPEIISPQEVLTKVFRSELSAALARHASNTQQAPALAMPRNLINVSRPELVREKISERIIREVPDQTNRDADPRILRALAQSTALISSLSNTAKAVNYASQASPGVQVAALAQGGVITRPTLALMGETAASRPEIASPERRLREIFRAESDIATRVEVVGTISNDVILLASEKAAERQKRIR